MEYEPTLAAALASDGGLQLGLVVAVFFAGLRHGFDLDHIAAITDISSSQLDRRRALYLSTIYALGHGVVLLALGALAVLAGRRIPAALDSAMGRLIGVTLVALGIYVVYSLIRFRSEFRLRSRWMLILSGIKRTIAWLKRARPRRVEIEHTHEHRGDGHHHRLDPEDSVAPASKSPIALKTRAHIHTHKHVVAEPADPFAEYGVATSFGIGMIHGVGAETPTQVLLFTTAAGISGGWAGMLVLAAFVGGLLCGNTILALATSTGFASGKKLPVVYLILAAITAFISVAIGALYVIDRPDLLPGILGG